MAQTSLYISFEVYTVGAPLDIDQNNLQGPANVGGIELHVWDLSGEG